MIIQNLKVGVHYIHQTLINFKGKYHLHSINDQPSLVISYKPLDRFDSQYLESMVNQDMKDDNSGSDILAVVWTKYGQIHRLVNYAVYINTDETNVAAIRYWVHKGMVRDQSQGYGYKEIFHSYIDTIDSTYWVESVPIQLSFDYAAPKFEISGIVESIIYQPNLTPHNDNGPAIFNLARDPKQRTKQPIENINPDPYVGPFPLTEYYYHGELMYSTKYWNLIKKNKLKNIKSKNTKSKNVK